MAYRSFDNPFGFSLTLWVRRLLIVNAVVFLVTLALPVLVSYLAFRPVDVLFQPWTPFTYMFVHAGFWHLFFNMLVLFFFGPVLEERWGSREFIKFYLISGFGGAALSLVFPQQAIVGASAAVYGLMVAFAVYWPENPIYIWGIFPVKAKWLVSFFVALSLFYAVAGGGGGVAHLAHLGGAAAAFFYIRSRWAPPAYGTTYSSPARKKRSWRDLLNLPKRKRRHLESVAPEQKSRTREEMRRFDEIDELLDKISQRGLSSLTPDERRRLEEASRRLGSN